MNESNENFSNKHLFRNESFLSKKLFTVYIPFLFFCFFQFYYYYLFNSQGQIVDAAWFILFEIVRANDVNFICVTKI